MRYGFIKAHQRQFRISSMCRVLEVHLSGYYARLREPLSARAKEDKRQAGLIKQAWLESGGVYGFRKIHADLRELGEACGVNRVHRLMRQAGIEAEVGYNRRRVHYGGKPAVVADNALNRQFDPIAPNQAWVP